MSELAPRRVKGQINLINGNEANFPAGLARPEAQEKGFNYTASAH